MRESNTRLPIKWGWLRMLVVLPLLLIGPVLIITLGSAGLLSRLCWAFLQLFANAWWFVQLLVKENW